MIIELKNKILLFIFTLILLLSLSCSEALHYPLTVEKFDFNPSIFKKSKIVILPPAAGDNEYKRTVRMILQAVLKKDYKKYDLILPDQCLKLIKKKNLENKLERVYAIYGDEEDNVLFAAAIGIDLKARFTVYSKVTNLIYYGREMYDTELLTRYNREYYATETYTAIRKRHFKSTIATGYLKIVDNEKHRIVWQVYNFKTGIEKIKGFKSVPIDDIMLQTYGEAYFRDMPKYPGYPSASRVLYRFYERILSEWP